MLLRCMCSLPYCSDLHISHGYSDIVLYLRFGIFDMGIDGMHLTSAVRANTFAKIIIRKFVLLYSLEIV